jgi:hypothetical protein
MRTLTWRNVPEKDFHLYARSFHEAAKRLAGTLDSNSVTTFDVCPVLSAYRKAVELSLKVIVLGEGRKFLPTKPDLMAIHKTRSVSWLAQFVRQIIIALKWEEIFKCEELGGLADFKAVIEEVNDIDPEFYTFRCPADPTASAAWNHATTVRAFIRRLDAVIDLLDNTADALASESDLRSGSNEWDDGIEFKPLVH